MKRALPLLVLGLLLYLLTALMIQSVEGFEPTVTPTPKPLRIAVSAPTATFLPPTPTLEPSATRRPAVRGLRYEYAPTLIPTPEPTLVPLPRPKGW
jgi:hypothetical protein